jgi:hypothetical protein
MFIFKMKTGRLNKSSQGIVTSGNRGEHKERVKQSEYGGNAMYSCREMEQ